MKKTIAVLPGDGMGPEIMAEAVKCLHKIAEKFGHEFILREAPIGGAAWDVCGEHLPKSTLDLCKESDALLFAAVGGRVEEQNTPKWKDCERNSILALRKAFNFQFNLRPTKVFKSLEALYLMKEKIDILCVRELSEDIYYGEHKIEGNEGHRKATDVMEYNESTIEDVAHVAFQFARKRTKKVSSVDKANVLACSRLWREVVSRVHKQHYPDCQLEHVLVDNCAMQIVLRPATFDVILLPNMFGDILSDEASVLSGSLGILPSASLNKKGFGLYEPISGSVPHLAGLGIVNPIGQILSVAMMLEYSFQLHKESEAIYVAVEKALADGKRTQDILIPDDPLPAISTNEMGDAIAQRI